MLGFLYKTSVRRLCFVIRSGSVLLDSLRFHHFSSFLCPALALTCCSACSAPTHLLTELWLVLRFVLPCGAPRSCLLPEMCDAGCLSSLIPPVFRSVMSLLRDLCPPFFVLICAGKIISSHCSITTLTSILHLLSTD